MISGLTYRIAGWCDDLCYRFGITAKQHQSSPNRAIVMFHSILPTQDRKLHLRNNSQNELRQTITYMQKVGTVIPLSQWMSDSLPNQFAITFDDGLLNNLLYAAPVLSELAVPATYFINTPSVFGQEHIWPELLAQYTYHWHHSIVLGQHVFQRHSYNRWLEKNTQRSLVSYLMAMDKPTLEFNLGAIKEQTHSNDLLDAHRVMNDQEILQLSQMPGVTIGSHGIDHRAMTTLNDLELEDSLKLSKRHLEKCIGKTVDCIAFPFGDVDARVYEITQSCGYSHLVGVDAKSDLPQLTKRFGFYNHESLATQLKSLSTYQ